MNSPKQIAANYLEASLVKANLPYGKMLLLSLLAGIFVAFAAIGANTAMCTVENASLAKLVAACVFPGGLTMVLMAGSELFTGNCLFIIPLLQRRLSPGRLLRVWGLVYLGNLLGSLLIVALAAGSRQWDLLDGAVALTTIKVAAGKMGYSLGRAFLLGVGCNFLVCVAIWVSMAATSVGGKLAGLFFPILLFVVSGFEHSVANMYYIPAGVLAAARPEWAELALEAGLELSSLTWSGFFLGNLLPVTLGNIVGGCGLGLAYWYCYLKNTAN